MSTALQDAVATARERVEDCRQQGSAAPLALALEAFASAAMKIGDVVGAATALEEAGDLWASLDRSEQSGSCLLLAASSYRVGMELAAAKRVLAAGRAATFSTRLRHGFEIEACEQDLANGRAVSAWDGFSRFLKSSVDELGPSVRSQLLQRRAAAAIACGRVPEAADDLLQASKIFLDAGHPADSEACALAAAGALAEVDAVAAERIMAGVLACVPTDGAAAVRRGVVGGKVAERAGKGRLALQRFDEARQGALDVGDPISYFAAAVAAAHAAEALGEGKTAYARLATAWASLSDALGRAQAAQMVQPELAALRDRLGAEHFAAAKLAYEMERKPRGSTS